MLTKEKLLKSLQNLPDEFSVDELLDRLFLLHKIETGQQQAIDNETISEEDLDNQISQWLA